MKRKNVLRGAIVAGAAALAVIGFQAIQPSAKTVMAAPAEKVTICHRAPNDTHYVLISTKFLSPFGAWGHYDAGGDPEPGHEGDVYPDANGECPCLGGNNGGH